MHKKIAFQLEADHLQMCITLHLYDLDPMTFICDLDLDVIKMYLNIKNEVSRPRLLKLRAQIGQTNRQTQPNALPHHICR